MLLQAAGMAFSVVLETVMLLRSSQEAEALIISQRITTVPNRTMQNRNINTGFDVGVVVKAESQNNTLNSTNDGFTTKNPTQGPKSENWLVYKNLNLKK